MNREWAKKFLEKQSNHREHGRDVREYREAMGDDNTLDLMERFQDILATPRAFIETEKKVVDLLETSISASQVQIFSLLGVSSIVQEAYEAPKDLPLQDACLVESSKTWQEPKAWLARPEMPDVLEDMQEPSESKVLPRSLIVTNQDFGKAFSISRRAIDDDQVGQLSRMPAMIGENHRLQEEIYAAGYLTGAGFVTNGVTVPTPAYTDPDGLGNGIYVTTTARANAITPAAFSQNALTALLQLSKKIQDWDGKSLLIRPNLIIGGVNVSFTAATVLNSAFWPSTQPAAGATPVGTGAPMAVNPLDPKWGALRSPLDYKEEPFFNFIDSTAAYDYSKAWYLIQTKHIGLIKQNRQPLETLMEAPNAGGSIRRRSYYHRTYRRYAYYIGDARFLFRGNDGSV